MKIRTWPLWAAVACALTVAVAACSGSATSSSVVKTQPSTEATSGPAAESQIAMNWTTFFDAKTPVDKRIALLEDGQTFAPVIKAQAGSGLASQASASVQKVAVTSPSQATVNYAIKVAGQTALPNQSGTAVYQSGIWKVGVTSFCGLLALQSGGSTASLPAACKTP